ncbi:putative ATPase [Stella humosa]|uniref:Putative ATPase n=1 Tax=Stella humosa TaxID=94 RepID=A0A3N1L0F1_9PROT|nr:AAA family ATPase [Stella humosa]ROP84068.1 putative ATPase [Stella humosa]BBK33579.1 hypothetical protein STHU_42130 [Stella humosa]
MPPPSFFIVTGGPGAGKTTLVEALSTAGLATAPEGGRAIIRQELASGGDALPWRDPAAFAARMMAHDRAQYRAARRRGRPCIFDRGIPDTIGYLRLTGLAVPAAMDRAARHLRYQPTVFVAPPWPAIYTTDAERRPTPQEAERTWAALCRTYVDHGYNLAPLPLAPVAERVAFVLARI